MSTKKIHLNNLMSEVVATANLDEAFSAIYQRRKKQGHNSDIWNLSRHWLRIRETLQTSLLSGEYQLSPVQVFRTAEGYVTQWCAEDAIVLKALSFILAPIISKACGATVHHLKGHGGLKGATRKIAEKINQFQYIIRSDVHQFYDSMNHNLVMNHCKEVIKDKRILNIIAQYLNRCEVLDGDHRLIEHGIPKGCPLSPLMGALMLKSLDTCVPDNCFYARYMDDWVILIKTRSQLKRLVKKMHLVMQGLKFELARDKTIIGKISKGFNFLGYRFNHQGIVGLAKQAIQRFFSRILALYEQNASDQRVREYVGRWRLRLSWACWVV